MAVGKISKEVLNSSLNAELSQFAEHLDNDVNPHSEKVERTITVGTGKDFATIQEAVNSVKRNLGGTGVTILVDDGIYDETLIIAGFHNGVIGIRSSTPNSTEIKFSLKNIIVKHCSCQVGLRNINFTTTNAAAIESVIVSSLMLFYCNITTNAPSNTGILTHWTNGYFYGIAVSNRMYGIFSSTKSNLLIREITGTSNVQALRADMGGVINKDGIVSIMGASNEVVATGGLIIP